MSSLSTWNFGPEDHGVLIQIVKESQRKDLKSKGKTWKEHAAADEGPVDPARRDWSFLAGFVESIHDEASRAVIGRMLKWDRKKRHAIAKETENPWPLTPEHALVVRTREHASYNNNYTFPSYGDDWVVTKVGSAGDVEEPERMLAVDCEMVLSVGNVRELVRVAVVDRDLNVLMNELVRPELTVMDWKTSTTGISAADLEPEGAALSHREAQKAVKRLLTRNTILVGHGLHHDLRALRIDHRRVIDTSLLMRYQDAPNSVPSLQDLCRFVLKMDFRAGSAVHDSIEDAIAPMKLILHELEHGPTVLQPPLLKVDREELKKLFVHRIPRGTTPNDLKTIFSPDHPCTIQGIVIGTSGYGTTHAVFGNPEHANKAFSELVGSSKNDSSGRAQKLVEFVAKGGVQTTITVRKMACHNGLAIGVDSRKGTPWKTAPKGPPVAEESPQQKGQQGKKAQAKGQTPEGKGQQLEEAKKGGKTPPSKSPGGGVAQQGGKREGIAKGGTEEGAKGRLVSPLASKPVPNSVSYKEGGGSERRGEGNGVDGNHEGSREEGGRAVGGKRKLDEREGGGERERWGEGGRGGGGRKGEMGGRGGRWGGGGSYGEKGNGGLDMEVEFVALRKRLEERDAEVAALQRLVTELATRPLKSSKMV